MKKIIALVFSLVFGLSLVACGGNGSNMGSDMRNGMSSIGSAAESLADNITGNNNSSSAKISENEAKAIALKHAGIEENNITGLSITLERDDGILEYEIDFHSNGFEYDYDINAQTGEIISSNKEKD